MWTAICLMFGFVFLVWIIVSAVYKKSEAQTKLQLLKEEARKHAEEHERANKIVRKINNMSSDDIRNRLQNLSDK